MITRAPVAAPDEPTLLDALAGSLESLLAVHDGIADCVRRRREALRAADLDRLAALEAEEEALARRARELDRARTRIAEAIAVHRGLPPRPTPRLEALVAAASPSRHARIARLAETLRERVVRTREEAAIVGAAAVALARHVGGIVQSAGAATDRTGVYGRRGRLAGGLKELRVDLRS